MKNKLIKLAAVAAVAGSLLLAQGPGPGRGNHPGGQRGFGMLGTALDLTDTQKEQAKAIFDAARQSAQPIQDQLKQGHEALANAVKTGKSDAEIDQLSSSLAPLLAQSTAIHTKAFAKVYAILTPEQKEKADKLHGQMHGMFQGRFGGPR